MEATTRGRAGTKALVGIGMVVGVALIAVLSVTVAGLGHTRAGTITVASTSSCTVGDSPYFDAYDPINQEIYVPNFASADLSVVKGCTVVATVSFPNSAAEPYAAAFDPTNNHIYVTDEFLNVVYVISDTKLINTIKSPLFNDPLGILYDPGDGVMAIANAASNDVVFLANNSHVIGTNSVGDSPESIGYDPFYARILVTNWASDNVTSINAVYPFTQTQNINIPVGTGPSEIAFDFQTQMDYVTNEISNNVTAFGGIDATGHYSINVSAEPAGIVWDQSKLSLYVVNEYFSNVTVIKGTAVVQTIPGPSGVAFVGVAYDDATDKVYATAANSPGLVYIYS